MKKHTRIYLDFFGYGEDDFIICEYCGLRASDIHHIKAKGMGGSKLKDHIENLMALCRECHMKYGDKVGYMTMLISAHNEFLLENGKI